MRKSKKKEPTRAERRAAKRAARLRQERKNASRRAKREAARAARGKPRAPDVPREETEGYVEIASPAVTQFDPNVGRYMRSQLVEAVASVADLNGVRAEVSKAEVDAEYGDAMKVTVVLRVPQFDAKGNEVPYRETAWLRYAHTLGLKTDWLGRKIQIGRVVYRIAGLDLRNKVKPVLLSHGDRLFCETVDTITKLVRG